jgi:2-polyprenyl-3-methyl-5-hydroxy-6-metoxy-1,4-benzoquinol methylase
MRSTIDNSSEHADLVQDYFDKNAQSWHDYYQAGNSLTHIILKERKKIGLEFLNRYLPPEQNPKVLDAGCGSGLIGVAMASQGYYVDGWDISEKMIALSRKNFDESGIPADQYSLKSGNLLESDLVPGSYGGIMALGFLQYQPNELEVLRQFHELLRPGGVLVLSGPVGAKLSNYFGLAEKIRRVRRRRSGKTANRIKDLERKQLHTISANSYSVGRFRYLLESAEFQMIAFRGHGYAHFDFLSRKLPNRHQKRLHHLLTKAGKILPIQRYANDMVIVARKTNAG